MKDDKQSQLSAKMIVCTYTVKELLARIYALEADIQATPEEKLSKIKKIKDEITKVGMEIDSIKKEITLLKTYRIN